MRTIRQRFSVLLPAYIGLSVFIVPGGAIEAYNGQTPWRWIMGGVAAIAIAALEELIYRSAQKRRRVREIVIEELQAVGVDGISGRYLRQLVWDRGVRPSLAGFYAEMARLEELGLVSGWDEIHQVSGVELKSRHYRATNRFDVSAISR